MVGKFEAARSLAGKRWTATPAPEYASFEPAGHA
jgi:hypothetical protein